MQIIDVVNSAWAIEPGKLQEIAAVYTTHTRGESIDLAAVEARIGKPLVNEPQAYSVLDGVAVISINGVIAKRANLMMQISGGTSSQLVGRDLRMAAADPAVHSILLHIDSPGGTVDGTQALADLVTEIGRKKTVYALGDGAMCSAAYWIGSAAAMVYVAETTTVVGSVGVVATHVDVSGAEAQKGIKTTEIFAGAYKRIASQYAPLTDAGRAAMQEQLDYTYSLFVDAVARQRHVSVDKVLSDMADGRIFQGKQAVDAGLVDGIATFDTVLAKLKQRKQAAGAVPLPAPSAQPAAQLAGINPAPLQPQKTIRTVPAAARAIPAGFTANMARAELDAQARAYMQSHRGISYLSAVLAVERMRQVG